ncbi:hypothetical protein BRD18_02360 [Halobacteriales archaeon SW_7_71_33]|nr:MAG: hypothetical protein BRD18_02360 [Halobacteriales archaeon SW_7_71_33]
MTCGYGERPWRVIGSSLFTVALFTPLYVATYDTPVRRPADLGDRLLFSLQSFTKYLVGDLPAPPNDTVQFLSSLEGLTGAFFVALLVFALTRQVHR